MQNTFFTEHLWTTASMFIFSAEHIQWLLLFIHLFTMINQYLFVLVKLLNAIAKSRLITWRIQ